MEKTYIRSLISFALVVLILAQVASATAYDEPGRRAKDQMDAMLASGSEIGGRLNRLVRGNEDVRAALDAFESKKLTPSLKEAWSLVVSIPPCDQSRSCESSLYLEAGDWRESISDGARIELIWIPSLNIEREWHGTAIAVLYGWDGSFIAQYVANIVMVNQDPSHRAWTVIYEAAVLGGELRTAIVSPEVMEEIDPGTPLGHWSDRLTSVPGANGGVLRANWQAWVRAAVRWCAATPQCDEPVAWTTKWTCGESGWLANVPSSVYWNLWK
jgi:hypothetical protein